jgi:hypothetical protein
MGAKERVGKQLEECGSNGCKGNCGPQRCQENVG